MADTLTSQHEQTSLSSAASLKVIEIARGCLDTPYHHQGRVKGVGMDCAGLPVYVCDELGIDYTDAKGYPRTPYRGMLKKMLDDQPGLYQVSTPEAGDVVLMRIVKDPQHIGIFTGRSIIHAYLTAGKVVEHVFNEKWRRRAVAFYRFSL